MSLELRGPSSAALSTTFERLISVNVKTKGAVGDGTTDDTAAIQAAIDEVSTNTAGGTITFPVGVYKLTAALVVNRGGLRFVGMSRRRTILRQTTAAANGITINRDTTSFGGATETFTRGFAVENMRIEGAGQGVSTGIGVSAVHGSTYAGQALNLRNVEFMYWDICARLTRWDNCYVSNTGFGYSRIGWWSDGNGNSHKLHGVGGTNCTEAAIRLGDGAAVEISAQDIISCGRMLDLLDQSTAVLHSYDFESCTGTTFVNIANGARLVTNHGRIIKNIGSDVPGFTVDNGGLLVLNGTPSWSGFTTSKLVKKINNSATVYGVGPSRSLSVAPEALVDDNGTMSYPLSTWPIRADNANPGATANTRNMLIGVLTRDTSTAADKLYWHGKDRTSGTDVYQRYLVTGRFEGTGSPEGVVTAPTGSLYTNTSGGANTTLYVKESGTGNTGWVAK